MKNNKQCKRLKEFLSAESNIIKKHIDEHKWFTQIEDFNDGIADFVTKYGWIIRELYCGYSCPERENCELAQEFLPKNITEEE